MASRQGRMASCQGGFEVQANFKPAGRADRMEMVLPFGPAVPGQTSLQAVNSVESLRVSPKSTILRLAFRSMAVANSSSRLPFEIDATCPSPVRGRMGGGIQRMRDARPRSCLGGLAPPRLAPPHGEGRGFDFNRKKSSRCPVSRVWPASSPWPDHRAGACPALLGPARGYRRGAGGSGRGSATGIAACPFPSGPRGPSA